MSICEWCENEFAPTGGWSQRFCCTQCRNAWNRRRRRQEAVEAAEEELRQGNGGTPEQREKATEGLAAIQASWSAGKFVRRI